MKNKILTLPTLTQIKLSLGKFKIIIAKYKVSKNISLKISNANNRNLTLIRTPIHALIQLHRNIRRAHTLYNFYYLEIKRKQQQKFEIINKNRLLKRHTRKTTALIKKFSRPGQHQVKLPHSFVATSTAMAYFSIYSDTE